MCYADICCRFDKSDSSTEGRLSFQIPYYKKGREFTRYFRPYRVLKTLSYNFRAPNTKNTDKSLYIFFHPWRNSSEAKLWDDTTEEEKTVILANWETHRPYQPMDLDASTAHDEVQSEAGSEDDNARSTDSDGFPQFGLVEFGNESAPERRAALQEVIDSQLAILNEKQIYVVSMVSDVLDCQRDGSSTGPLRCVIQGKAGTGKSTVIRLLSAITKLKYYQLERPVPLESQLSTLGP